MRLEQKPDPQPPKAPPLSVTSGILDSSDPVTSSINGGRGLLHSLLPPSDNRLTIEPCIFSTSIIAIGEPSFRVVSVPLSQSVPSLSGAHLSVR